MRIIFTFFLCFLFTRTFAQAERKISTYLLAQYNKTVYDGTMGNNPWGAGLGLQLFFNNKSDFKPTIDFTADTYLEDDKLLRLNTDGSTPTNYNDVRGMINLFAGASFFPTRNMYVSLVGGPGIIGEHILFGVKPSVGFYFSDDHKWTGKLSFINVFDRYQITKEDFGTLSFSIGHKLF
jgi:hypothetical protein